MTEMKDYIYLLDMSETNFFQELEQNKGINRQHLQYLKKLKKQNKLILAGTSLDNFYEIVIFKEIDEKNAEKIMNKDPLVKENILPGTLCDFRASLITKEETESLLSSKQMDFGKVYNSEVVTHYLGTITGRPTFVNDATDEEMKIMSDHYQYLKKNVNEKKMIFAGPILSEGKFGITILSVKTLKAAENIMKKDPSIKAKIMELGLHPFQLFLI